MLNLKRYNIKSILVSIAWVLVGAASIVLLVAAVHKKDQRFCKGLDINITGVSNNFFIDQSDVKNIIAEFAGKKPVGKRIEDFNLRAMETALKKDVWIKEAQLFFDNNEVLQANIEEREPIARVFTTNGSTFYVDSSDMKLPLSDKFSARVPVFTGFPTDVIILTKQDSSLLHDIKNLSLQIQADSFLMAMIEQVDITPERNFEMVPKIGNQVIVFGDASDAEKKFNKLKLFYKKVIPKIGWTKYSMISLQYKNQVVAKIRGKDDVSADSLRTIEMMELIAKNAAKMAEDSIRSFSADNEKKHTDVSIIQQSLQREELGDNSDAEEVAKPAEKVNLPVEKTVVAPAKKQPVKPAVVKPAAKTVQKRLADPVIKPAVKPVENKTTEKPKAVMPKKNDY